MKLLRTTCIYENEQMWEFVNTLWVLLRVSWALNSLNSKFSRTNFYTLNPRKGNKTSRMSFSRNRQRSSRLVLEILGFGLTAARKTTHVLNALETRNWETESFALRRPTLEICSFCRDMAVGVVLALLVGGPPPWDRGHSPFFTHPQG